jgi:hypothetical protein
MYRREAVIGDWRKLRTEELYDWYCSPCYSGDKRVMWRVWERTVMHTTLVGKSEGRRLFRWCGVRWEDKMGMDPKEIRCEAVDRIDVVQDKTCPPIMDTVMRCYVPQNAVVS